jgi:hypothetical protein
VRTAQAARVTVENVNRPGNRRQVDAAMYRAMRRAVLKVLPSRGPGMTLAELSAAVRLQLPENLYPGGARAGWWLKTVQLDLETKQVIERVKTSPLRLHRRKPA